MRGGVGVVRGDVRGDIFPDKDPGDHEHRENCQFEDDAQRRDEEAFGSTRLLAFVAVGRPIRAFFTFFFLIFSRLFAIPGITLVPGQIVMLFERCGDPVHGLGQAIHFLGRSVSGSRGAVFHTMSNPSAICSSQTGPPGGENLGANVTFQARGCSLLAPRKVGRGG